MFLKEVNISLAKNSQELRTSFSFKNAEVFWKLTWDLFWNSPPGGGPEDRPLFISPVLD